jgi:small subunit ribosomal protein S16
MVKIRLRRVGAKKQPHYRVVVADSRSPRDGKFIEIIGHYNPRTEPPTVQIDDERALYWLTVGAQPTAAVHRMLDKLGIMARFEAHRLGGPPAPEAEAEPKEEALAEVAKADLAEEEADLVEPDEEVLWSYSDEDESEYEDDLEYDEDDLEYDEDQEEEDDDLEEEED